MLSEQTYTVTRWSSGFGELKELKYRRAFVAMSVSRVSRQWLETYSGLSKSEIRLLLSALLKEGILEVDRSGAGGKTLDGRSARNVPVLRELAIVGNGRPAQAPAAANHLPSEHAEKRTASIVIISWLLALLGKQKTRIAPSLTPREQPAPAKDHPSPTQQAVNKDRFTARVLVRGLSLADMTCLGTVLRLEAHQLSRQWSVVTSGDADLAVIRADDASAVLAMAIPPLAVLQIVEARPGRTSRGGYLVGRLVPSALISTLHQVDGQLAQLIRAAEGRSDTPRAIT